MTEGHVVPETMTIVDILRGARALIEDPSRWTQGRTARQKHGFAVASDSPEAVCWCALGALNKVSGYRSSDVLVSLLHRVIAEPQFGSGSLKFGGGSWSIGTFNDSHDHATVLAMFDRAIEVAVGRGTHAEIAKEQAR